ncbi:hypothetical protein Pelo_12015 [Pelomyxa schiedti]|nr:hypothetical protein Pelo_12015 [Pelomyxa schiedti]
MGASLSSALEPWNPATTATTPALEPTVTLEALVLVVRCEHAPAALLVRALWVCRATRAAARASLVSRLLRHAAVWVPETSPLLPLPPDPAGSLLVRLCDYSRWGIGPPMPPPAPGPVAPGASRISRPASLGDCEWDDGYMCSCGADCRSCSTRVALAAWPVVPPPGPCDSGTAASASDSGSTSTSSSTSVSVCECASDSGSTSCERSDGRAAEVSERTLEAIVGHCIGPTRSCRKEHMKGALGGQLKRLSRACPQIRGTALILGLVSSELETRFEDFCEDPQTRDPISVGLCTFIFTLADTSPIRVFLLLDTRSQFTGLEMLCRCKGSRKGEPKPRKAKETFIECLNHVNF